MDDTKNKPREKKKKIFLCITYYEERGGWIVRSGTAWAGNLRNQGNAAYYWSSTVGGSDSAYYLDLNSTVIRPAVSIYRAYGFSVRCLAR